MTIEQNEKDPISSATRQIIATTAGADVNSVQSHVKLLADLGVSSFDMMNIFLKLETQLGVFIDEDDIINIITVQDLVDLVWAQRDGSAGELL